MSFLSTLKHKTTAETAPAITAPAGTASTEIAPDETAPTATALTEEQELMMANTPSESFDPDNKEQYYSEQYMLRELTKAEEKYPGILQEVRPHISKVRFIIKKHLESIHKYREWEKAILNPEQTEFPEAAGDSAATVDSGTAEASMAEGNSESAEAGMASEESEAAKSLRKLKALKAAKASEESEAAKSLKRLKALKAARASEESEVAKSLKKLQALKALKALEASGASKASKDLPKKELPPPPVAEADASVKVFVSRDYMYGFIYCLSPIGNGKTLDKAMIKTALEKYGITYGIIELSISRIFVKKDFFCIYPIAVGTAPIRGENGIVTERFLRTQKMQLRENEKGVIDYKNLNLFTDVKKGDIICDLTAPTGGQDGCDVLGRTVPAQPGKMPSIPKGMNTVINDDSTALIANIDGVLSFQRDVFRIEHQLTISGNVDSSTGNIDFSGDVLVMGDVLRGFRIKANGNIIVLGMAEGATLISDEDIDIRKGMNGSGSGILDAKGDIHARFLEQTQVTAGSNVVAETIINCRIVSGGSIFATVGKGIIIGGTLSVNNSVEAKRIGGTSDTKTIIKLGVSMLDEENLEYLNAELAHAKDTFRKLDKNLTYLKSLPSLPPDKEGLTKTLTEQRQLYADMARDLQYKIDAAILKASDFKNCYVHGDIVYAITEVTLNYSKLCIQETTRKCNVHYVDDGLTLGTF